MRVALLDVSVLFALIYERHARHADVQTWFAESGSLSWATCAYTQMSAIRLLTSGFASDLNLTTADAAGFLRRLAKHPCHQYWQQDVVPSDEDTFVWRRALGRNQFPDLYLLALAVRNDGVLVTLDRKIELSSVRGAMPHHLAVL